jgi:hypothetical protein
MATIKKPNQFAVIDHNGNNIYANFKRDVLDIHNASINPRIYNYLNYIFDKKQEIDIIRDANHIGYKVNDKILVLTNLFFLCARKNRVSLMQRIVTHIKEYYPKNNQEYINFMINAYDRGNTPLMHAAYNGSISCLKILLIWGANINEINSYNEDIVSAANNGLAARIKENPTYELFENKKYQEVITFIDHWKMNGHQLMLELNAEMKFQLPNSEKKGKIDPSTDIQGQIDRLLLTYIENSNGNLMKELFEEISSNKYIIDKSIIKKYQEDLIEDFEDIYEKYVKPCISQ